MPPWPRRKTPEATARITTGVKSLFSLGQRRGLIDVMEKAAAGDNLESLQEPALAGESGDKPRGPLSRLCAEIFYIDLRSLAPYRIGLGLVIIADLMLTGIFYSIGLA